MSDAKLTDEQQEYVVQRLAGYDSPSAVAKGLKEDFGVTITRQSIEYYDPTKEAGKDLAEKWRVLFDATRKAIIDGKADIGAANKMVRVRWREIMAQRKMDQGDYKTANDILDAIAKEMGDGFSNKRQHEHSGPAGAPLTATIVLTGRPEPSPSPQAVDSVREPGD
jgi:hypothetical protein